MASPSRNARKRAASEDIYDTNRLHDPSFRDGGPDRVKSEEEPVALSFDSERGKHGYHV
jgi:hypothetical protein